MTVTINHLRSLSALYPCLQMEIRAQNFKGEFWHDGPCLGFVVDGEFITRVRRSRWMPWPPSMRCFSNASTMKTAP
ncbi:hypothetical protein AWV79_35455 [Cupriavidus sp. UYMMa02A]|nr:hypothetical protein AWV79_35455 [Cupriavidus sp. UYMMa02A]